MSQKGRAIFLVYTDLADPRYEEEFNAWYDTEHLPLLLTLPGVLDAARYEAVKGGPRYLAVYEMESAETALRPEFRKRRRTPWERRIAPSVIGTNLARILGEQIYPDAVEDPERGMAPALQIGRMSVPGDIEAEWNAWYNTEFIRGFRKVPGVLCARRYRVVEGEVRYATVYEFEHDKVSESAEWDHQREHSSPTSGRMLRAMSMAAGSPGVYRRIERPSKS